MSGQCAWHADATCKCVETEGRLCAGHDQIRSSLAPIVPLAAHQSRSRLPGSEHELRLVWILVDSLV